MDGDSSTVSRDYLVTPQLGPGPGVLVVHSGRGLTEFVDRFCHRLAREGFVTLAPDLFGGETPETVEAADARKASLDPDWTHRQLEDAASFLAQYEAVSRRRIGVVGFGYGAELACDLAPAMGADCGALVLFYGIRPTEWARVEAPVQGHFAERDHDIPESVVRDLRATLDSHGVPNDLAVYAGTDPSFFETDPTARHDPEAAGKAWSRTRRFLADELQRPDRR